MVALLELRMAHAQRVKELQADKASKELLLSDLQRKYSEEVQARQAAEEAARQAEGAVGRLAAEFEATQLVEAQLRTEYEGELRVQEQFYDERLEEVQRDCERALSVRNAGDEQRLSAAEARARAMEAEAGALREQLQVHQEERVANEELVDADAKRERDLKFEALRAESTHAVQQAEARMRDGHNGVLSRLISRHVLETNALQAELDETRVALQGAAQEYDELSVFVWELEAQQAQRLAEGLEALQSEGEELRVLERERAATVVELERTMKRLVAEQWVDRQIQSRVAEASERFSVWLRELEEEARAKEKALQALGSELEQSRSVSEARLEELAAEYRGAVEANRRRVSLTTAQAAFDDKERTLSEAHRKDLRDAKARQEEELGAVQTHWQRAM